MSSRHSDLSNPTVRRSRLTLFLRLPSFVIFVTSLHCFLFLLLEKRRYTKFRHVHVFPVALSSIMRDADEFRMAVNTDHTRNPLKMQITKVTMQHTNGGWLKKSLSFGIRHDFKQKSKPFDAYEDVLVKTFTGIDKCTHIRRNEAAIEICMHDVTDFRHPYTVLHESTTAESKTSLFSYLVHGNFFLGIEILTLHRLEFISPLLAK